MAVIKPFITKNNYCMHCNTKECLEYIDLSGKHYKNLIYPVMGAECTSCNHKYFIRWIKDEKTNELIPFYDEAELIDEFSDKICTYAKAHRRILK